MDAVVSQTPEQTNSFAAPIFNFPLWNVAEPHKNGRGDRHTPHGNPSDDAHLQQPFIPGSDDDDAFSFGDAMLVDEGIVDSTVDKSNKDQGASQNSAPGQAERIDNDVTTIAAVPLGHTETCGPSEIRSNDDKRSVTTSAVRIMSKTSP